MKNVAIIIDSMAGGGAEKVMLTLAQTLLAQSHQVSIFTLKDSIDYVLPESINIVHALRGYKRKLRGWSRRFEQAERLQSAIRKVEQEFGLFDLVLVNLYESMKLAQVMNLPNSVYVMHNDCKSELKRESLMGPVKYWYMRKIQKGLDGKRLVGVSKALTHSLNQNALFKPASAAPIYNPLDLQRVRQLAEQSGPQLPQKYVLHVGRAAKAKRHDVLFEAFARVDSDYKLVCLSSGVKKLEKLARKYNIQERVILPGFEQNPYRWMKSADLVVLSSDFEGLAMVLIEALACGTQVVSTDCPFGPSEVLSGGLEKNLVPINDPEALANTINKALEDNQREDPSDNKILQNMPILNLVSPETVAEQYLSLTTEENDIETC